MAPQPESTQEQDEEACRRAEALFLAGDVRAGHRMAKRAQTLCPALPGIASTLAAYAVHAAAANRGGRPDWRAVLGLGRAQHRQEEQLRAGLSEHDVIRRQFRRMSLLVHPDKNPSVAADGAFKLLRQACDALSATASRPRPGNATAAATAAAGAEHHRHSYATASMRGTYAQAAAKHTPSPATTKKPTTATAGNHRPSNETAAKHTADHWCNTAGYASAAGHDDDYCYYDYHDCYGYPNDYYDYHGQDDTAKTHTPAAGHKDYDDTAETHKQPATANKDDDHDGPFGPREDIRIICLSCEGWLTTEVGVPVAGSECPWCGQTMTMVPP